ncbi:DUF58 domain-containing protein [Rhodocytophaga aerolata]|uniref:DUF58 domain-containing protein n=1 Tax=Rhodocytophaga aerolata TaxID=455078 RepID=A0ABT8R183_9BACT|nr:DUF58 domain-containing protein [Rhodocytophaga aerolata]MDO1445847.1 DUF58 domain-containing protein [Rhodocytophaga aerolata]
MSDKKRYTTPAQWFNPEELQSLKGLEWLARKLAHETLSGLHSGKQLGQGTDFSQYRSYMPGDDLRRVDWKLYGRTDRLYVKESELESRTRWYGILDASASMQYEESNISKWQYAKILWAAITYIARQQGDTDGIVLVNDKQVEHLPPKPGAEQARMQLLYEAKVAGVWPSTITLPALQAGFRNKFILITDLYEQANELGSFIRSLLPAKNQVVVFHLMGRQEMELDFKETTIFEDAETGRQIETDTAKIREAYQTNVASYLQQCRNQVLGWHAEYHLCQMPKSPVNELRLFLRNQVKG